MIARVRRRRRLLLAGCGLLVLLSGLALGAYATREEAPPDLVNPGVAFELPDPAAVPAPAAPPPEETKTFEWPFYGYDRARTRTFALATPARPPFLFRWAVRGDDLLEFGPVAGGNSLFLLKNNGALYAIKRRTGVVYWKKKLGHLAASSPAYWEGIVFATILESEKGSGKGRIVAFNTEYPRVRWSRELPSRSESSPIVVRGTLYFGSESGRVYALDARTGAVRWTYEASGAVKAGLAYADGKLFFGDYAGRVHAVDAATGRKLWRRDESGRFYATPSVAFGRVYLGNANGSVYSFSARDGALAWRRGTGDYVYSAAAIADERGIGPAVYVGSYDGTLYALDARDGARRWTHRTEGRISGGIQIVGDLVFYSTLNGHTTAVGAATGRVVWTVAKGKFNPVITDGRYLFLNGSTSLFAYDLRSGKGPVKEVPGDRPELLSERALEQRRAERRERARERERRRAERRE